jgi:hypothetical protein
MSLSARQIALALGVSHTAVNKATASGRIAREPDGGFDLERVKVAWAQNSDMRRLQTPISISEAPAPLAPAAPAPITSESDEYAAPTQGSLREVQLERERIKRDRERLALDAQLARLIDADEVKAAQIERAMAERESWLNWPSRAAYGLAAELGVDERVMFTLLDTAVRKHLTERSSAALPGIAA